MTAMTYEEEEMSKIESREPDFFDELLKELFESYPCRWSGPVVNNDS